MSKNNCD